MTKDLLDYFRQKQKDYTTETVFDTQCPFCSVQCTMQLVEERVVGRNRYKVLAKDNPTSNGRLCMKGLCAHQHALHPERLQFPLLKKNGRFVRVSWEEALSFIRDRFTAIQTAFGNDAVGVYGGGSLTNEEAYLLGKFARVALKTKYIDYNGRYCMSAAAAAMNATFGIDRGLTNKLSEIPHARCILLAGTNIAECQPTIMPYFRQAKKNGAFIIVIDPRETATSELADLHIKVKPGTDAALVNGMLAVILAEGYVDEAFVKERTEGYEELKKHIEHIQLDDIAAMTGVAKEIIAFAARQYALAPAGMIFTARGVEQQTNGYMTVRNFLNLALVTGKIGKIGCGYGAVTGQGNGQGGREHGQKADQLPGYRSIENQAHRQYIASVWGVPEEELPRKGVSAYEMMQKVAAGEIKAMIMMGSNPVVSSPNAGFVERALKTLQCFVVVDLFLSETAELADVVLPTSSYLEDEGTMTNLEGRVTWRPASRKRLGEVKHDWEILCELAKVLGKGEYFSFSSAEEIFDELRVASRGGLADYYGITYERLRRERVYWPCPSLEHPGTARLFEHSFAHHDGKARLAVVENKYEKEEPTEHYPLYVTTGRVLAHYLSGTQTRRSPTLASRQIEAVMEIHPNTAKKYKIENNALVKIETKRGAAVVRSKYSYKIREDTVFVPFHWSGIQNINQITDDRLDPYCKMPGFKICAARIRSVVDLEKN
ncbi:assimilatory nitrate reductase catalytic subunit NasC [Anoxybacillus sp. J5B_2022]|uniref:assimilatory nitrate reductase catalytic subunit NasC n=1 Tax=Anoxybacillus sp. J5B_2022 TaxID=3003246 RepID=UPI0022860608|nr:nitrate reductase [Anoxybacillus sp. J5B_2022]MCZ0755760.1 nitrate reductase [Anoxybacillus sp. J5B_2022]